MAELKEGFYWVRILHLIPSRWTGPTIAYFNPEADDWDLPGLNEPWPDSGRVWVLSDTPITPPEVTLPLDAASRVRGRRAGVESPGLAPQNAMGSTCACARVAK